MLVRELRDGGIVIYSSPRLASIGVVHAFSTRLGGVSPAPFDSMNLGNPNGANVQDDYARIWENYRLLQSAIGRAAARLCRVHQIHGNQSVLVERAADFDNATKADALISADPGAMLSVRIADCVPVLLASGDGRWVAAVHAGWRGVVGGVVPAALTRLIACSGQADVIAAIGPCISADHYQVGPEVVEAFGAAFGSAAPVHRGADAIRVDLREAVRLQLLRCGVTDDRMDCTDRCTCRDADEFFSHRRERGITGRMAALISPAAA